MQHTQILYYYTQTGRGGQLQWVDKLPQDLPKAKNSLPSERLWVVMQLQHDSLWVQSHLTQDDRSTWLWGNTLVFKICLWPCLLWRAVFINSIQFPPVIVHLHSQGLRLGESLRAKEAMLLCEADVLQNHRVVPWPVQHGACQWQSGPWRLIDLLASQRSHPHSSDSSRLPLCIDLGVESRIEGWLRAKGEHPRSLWGLCHRAMWTPRPVLFIVDVLMWLSFHSWVLWNHHGFHSDRPGGGKRMEGCSVGCWVLCGAVIGNLFVCVPCQFILCPRLLPEF